MLQGRELSAVWRLSANQWELGRPHVPLTAELLLVSVLRWVRTRVQQGLARVIERY